jgi:hypothetical protein
VRSVRSPVGGDVSGPSRRQRGGMQRSSSTRPAPEALYEVLLDDGFPPSLRARFPQVRVAVSEVQTSFARPGGTPEQLDALLEKVGASGVHLLEVHRSAGTPGAGATYEVRVEGEMGAPLLRHLAWPYRVVPRQTLVRIRSSGGQLTRFLEACTECGARIQRVRRVASTGSEELLAT